MKKFNRLSPPRYRRQKLQEDLSKGSMVKWKRSHIIPAFIFGPFADLTSHSQPFWPIRNIVYLCFGESEGLFTSDVRPSNRARTLIGQSRVYFSLVGLIWLYFIRLCFSFTWLWGRALQFKKMSNQISLCWYDSALGPSWYDEFDIYYMLYVNNSSNSIHRYGQRCSIIYINFSEVSYWLGGF